jgi:hypothetical protein
VTKLVIPSHVAELVSGQLLRLPTTEAAQTSQSCDSVTVSGTEIYPAICLPGICEICCGTALAVVSVTRQSEAAQYFQCRHLA